MTSLATVKIKNDVKSTNFCLESSDCMLKFILKEETKLDQPVEGLNTWSPEPENCLKRLFPLPWMNICKIPGFVVCAACVSECV